MGINRPSLYAAFGDKAALFREAVARYGAGPGRYVRRALGQPTARLVAETLLRGAVANATDPIPPRRLPLGAWSAGHRPRVGPQSATRSTALRARGIDQIRARLERARTDGDLPAGTDTEALTFFVISMMHGIAVQAAGGFTREQLQRAADLAMTLWPA
jgi:AcrR family transcriptional regulator